MQWFSVNLGQGLPGLPQAKASDITASARAPPSAAGALSNHGSMRYEFGQVGSPTRPRCCRLAGETGKG